MLVEYSFLIQLFTNITDIVWNLVPNDSVEASEGYF